MASPRKVITIISDGKTVPEMYCQDRKRLNDRITRFKSAGGIVMCVGIRAAGAGYAWLRSLASGGFFLNVTAADQVDAAIDELKCMMGHLCGRQPASYACGYGYGSTVPPAQEIDPEEQPDIEPELATVTQDPIVTSSTPPPPPPSTPTTPTV